MSATASSFSPFLSCFALCCAHIHLAASRCCIRYAFRSGASESSRESVRAACSSCWRFIRNMSSQLGVYPVLSAAAAAASAAAFAAPVFDASPSARRRRYSCTWPRPSTAAASAPAAPSAAATDPLVSAGATAVLSPVLSPVPSFRSVCSSLLHQVSSQLANRVFLLASRMDPIIAAFSSSVSALRCQLSMLCRTSAPVRPMMSPTNRPCSPIVKCFSNSGQSSASSLATCVSRQTFTATQAA
mmetsp:Transcript_8644/g.39309  ORF Transcript_8644/g.39309 Transcript_8644/m.39309 type:complete len:243 (+) Transcript_8644:1101-1829(+)